MGKRQPVDSLGGRERQIMEAVHRLGEATVNDVLVTCVSGTLHGYLERHDVRCASVNWMIPVNLKPLDAALPEELGNSFAIVQLELPTNTADPLAVLAVVRRRMGRIKNGHEAAVASPSHAWPLSRSPTFP